MHKTYIGALAIGAALLAPGCGQDAPATNAASAKGKIYVMRHLDKTADKDNRVKATGAGGGSLEVASIAAARRDGAHCFVDRGLTQQGVDRAGDVAAEFKSGAIVIDAAYSSYLCRTAHTAFLVSGVVADARTGDGDGAANATFVGAVKTAAATGNVLVVLHSNQLNNFVGLLAPGANWPASQCYGEVHRFKLTNGQWVADGALTDAVTNKSGTKTCHQ